ncbi:MAG: DUF11 domain-containing protein [Planctomycetes bacterium]|nr:DUF11 domain-containing protein [Planctomycetota bacterium]
MTVDDFATDDTITANGGTAFIATSNAGTLGGERDLFAEELASAGNVLVRTQTSQLQIAAAASGRFEIQYDGGDGDAEVLDPTGLGGVDLTVGQTQNAFVIRVANNAALFNLDITVYTDGTDFSRTTLAIPATAAALVLRVPFSTIPTAGGAGADFSNVGAITLSGNVATGASISFTPDFDTRQEITASLVASLQVDVNSDGFYQPGDTIRYIATITNPNDDADRAINNVDIIVPIPADTTLVPASVVTTGTVNVDPLAVNVTFATIADAASVTVQFDALIDDPILNAGVFQITTQGDITEGSASADFIDIIEFTDNVAPPVTPNPTVVDLNHYITGVVFIDDDGDGFDNDTMPQSMVVVNLLDSAGNPLVPPLTDTTDASGVYSFSPAATAGPDSFIVEVVPPGTEVFTVQDQTVPAPDDAIDSDVAVGTGRTAVITFTEATNIADIDAGYYTEVTISGMAFSDDDGSGQFDGAEVGFDGMTVTLFDATDPMALVAVGAPVDTAGGGLYSFTNLRPRPYIVAFDPADLPVGFGFTIQDTGADATDSDVDPDSSSLTHGQTAIIVTTSGVDNTTTFAGITTSTVSGRVFEDLNDNGVYDAGVDGLLDGITVEIFDATDPMALVSVTSMATVAGLYSFDVPPGDYVVFVDPAQLTGLGNGYEFIPEGTGSDVEDGFAPIADVLRVQGETTVLTLIAGTPLANVDAGVNNIVDITVTKTVSNPSPVDGDTVTYTITVTNNDDRNQAVAVETTDDFGGSGGLTAITEITNTGGAFDTGSGIWSVGTLAPGASATLTYDATIDFVAGGPLITNTVTVTGIQGVDPTIEDLDQDDNDDTATVSVSGGAIKVTNMNLSLNFKKHLFPTGNLTDTLTASGRINLAAFVTASVDEAAFLTEVRFYAFRVVVGTPGGPVDVTLNTPMKASSRGVSWQSNRSARPFVRASFSPTTGAFSVSIVNDDIFDALGAPAALNMLPAPATVDVPLALCIGPFNVDPATGDPAEYATNSLVYTLRKPDTVGKGSFRFGSVGQPPTELTFVDSLVITQSGNVIDGFEQRAQVKACLVRDPLDPPFDPATFSVDIGVGSMAAVNIPPGSFTGTNGKFSLTGPAALALGFSQVSYDETRFMFTFTTDWLPDGTFGEPAIADIPGDPRRAIIVPIQVSITDGMATVTNFLASGAAGRKGAVFSSTAPTVIFAGQ